MRKILFVILLLIAILNFGALVPGEGSACPMAGGGPVLPITSGVLALLALVLAAKLTCPCRMPSAEAVQEEKPAKEEKKTPTKPAKKAAPSQSEAITLLSALQREARFIDFLMESLDGFQDAQVGAVAREVHRDCGQVVKRMFAIEPLLDAEENAQVDVPEGYDPGQYRLTGAVSGEGPFAGQLTHHGWKAAKCDVPKWSGKKESSQVIAPAEVEI